MKQKCKLAGAAMLMPAVVLSTSCAVLLGVAGTLAAMAVRSTVDGHRKADALLLATLVCMALPVMLFCGAGAVPVVLEAAGLHLLLRTGGDDCYEDCDEQKACVSAMTVAARPEPVRELPQEPVRLVASSSGVYRDPDGVPVFVGLGHGTLIEAETADDK